MGNNKENYKELIISCRYGGKYKVITKEEAIDRFKKGKEVYMIYELYGTDVPITSLKDFEENATFGVLIEDNN